MTKRALLVLCSLAAVARAAPAEGPESLCMKVARVAQAALEKSPAFSLQIAAEGAAVDLADPVRAWCELSLSTDTRHAVLGADDVVRLRLRVTGSTLVSTVDVLHAKKAIASETVDAPLGTTLATWTGAGGSGLETWLAGTIDGDVLALCGGDADKDGIADVLVLTGESVSWLRWSASAIELAGSVPVSPRVRPRARVPGALASCFELPDGLGASFAVPDRNTTGAVSLRGTTLDWRGEVAGLELARFPEALLEATGQVGTPLFRWGSRIFAGAAGAPSTADTLGSMLFVTQDGAPFAALNATLATLSEKDLKPFGDGKVRIGTSPVAADVDGDGAPEFVTTRAAIDGPEATDRFSAFGLAPVALRHESQPIRGSLGALGAVHVGDWARVLGAQKVGTRTNLYAYGRRRGDVR